MKWPIKTRSRYHGNRAHGKPVRVEFQFRRQLGSEIGRSDFAPSSRRPRQSLLLRDLWVQGDDAFSSCREDNTCASPGRGEISEEWKASGVNTRVDPLRERIDHCLIERSARDHLLGKSREALTPQQSPTRFNGGCIDSANRARNARRGCPRTAGLLPPGVAASDCSDRTSDRGQLPSRDGR
jgi:hypothetical protein